MNRFTLSARKAVLAFLLMIFALSTTLTPVNAQGDITAVELALPAAQAGVTIDRNEAIPEYPERIVFHMAATSDVEIVEAELNFAPDALKCGESTSRAIPEDFSAGTSIETEYDWKMRETGTLPPGTTVSWSWALTDANGQVTNTPEQSLVFMDENYDWQTVKSDNLTVYWYEGPQSFAEGLLRSGEEALLQLRQDTGVEVERPIQIFTYANSSAMQASTLFAPAWSGGLALPRYSTVLIAVEPDDREWGRRVVRHELTHVIVGHFTFSCVDSTPGWMDEGLAVFIEGGMTDSMEEQLTTAIDNDTLLSVYELGQIFSANRNLAIQSYAQSESLVEFLVETYGQDQMLQLLEQFRAGVSIDQALQIVYDMDRIELEVAWREWVGAAPLVLADYVETSTPTLYPTFEPITGPGSTTDDAATATPDAAAPEVTMTPMPTARPVMVASAENIPGYYTNTQQGISLDFPVDWDVMGIDESDTSLLFAGSPDSNLLILLRTDSLDNWETFEEPAAELLDTLQSALEVTDVQIDQTSTKYILADGTDAWRKTATGTSDDSPIAFDVVAVTGANRVFMLATVNYTPSDPQGEAILETIRQSLNILMPTAYGISRENALIYAGGEPNTLDPARWLSSAEGIVGDLFSGLVQLDTNLKPAPDLAESWLVSADGMVYTFNLRRNVTFHDGRPFTAADVKYSWERALSPGLGSRTASTYLGDILGVEAVINGETSAISGVEIIDDYTLAVTLDAPKVYFLSKLSYPTAWIVDMNTVDNIEDAPNGTGPFKLVRHDEDEVIILERNPNYYRGFVSLEYIVYDLTVGSWTRAYESGDIDLTAINKDLLERATTPGDPLFGNTHLVTELCTSYITFDTAQPPFDDPLVRRAFAMAVDRQRFVDIVFDGQRLMAKGLFPPGLPGYNPDAQPLPYEPELARQTLNESSYGGSDGLPEIVFTASGAGTDVPSYVAVLNQMWQEALGVSIRVELLSSANYYEQIYAGNHGQIMYGGWCADYPDPENFADILYHSQSEQNWSNYNNPELDALLEQARSETDLVARHALYHQIEQMLIDDAPAVFMVHQEPYYKLTKPYVQGYVGTPIGVAQDMNLRIVR